MGVFRFVVSAGIALAFVSSGVMVVAQSSTASLLDAYNPLITALNEHYLFADDRIRVVELRRSRETRICTGPSHHQVALAITADTRQLEIGPRECITVEAKTIDLQAARPLDPRTTIKVDVATFAKR